MSGPAIRVLESFPEPKATTNPYIVQLAAALRETPGVRLSTFSVRTALFGRYDVFHVHWPDNLIGGHKVLGRIARRLTSALFFARLQLTRTPVVRTWHNLERPAGLGRIDTVLLDWLDALTTLRIRLNDSTDPGAHRVVTIPHGHYRDWYAPFARSPRQPGHLAYAGLVRAYKGVDELITAFTATTAPGLTLAVTGKPGGPEQAAQVRSLAGDDPRVTFDLRYVDEAELVTALTRAELVALPYRHLHNSGTVLAALSLNRPVLVPNGEVTRRLAAEVGEEWVIRFDGGLTPAVLEAAAGRAATISESAAPDLSRRGWADAGAAHSEAFAEALRLRGHR